MQVVPLEARRRCDGDHGTALVEAAFLSPILFYFLFGLLEMGIYFRDYLTLGAATQDAARTGAILGDDSTADFQLINAVEKATAGIPTKTVTKIVVFKATSATSTAPSACTSMATSGSSGTPNFCNTYTPAIDFVETDASKYDCLASPKDRSNGFCPSKRKTALAGANSPPDFLGIYIEFKHPYLTGLFGTSKVMAETVITRLEPRAAS
jgi:Flp pilus assembly protein TadG